MTLCVFALIASEFMPVSLLTPIAGDLGVTEGQAGQGIAISGAFAVVTSLSVTTIAARMDRKRLLLVLTAIMAASAALVGFAPNYLVYMIGRALIGVVIGGFWSMSAATAMRLVPAHLVPRALAVFNGGGALASVIAPPLGSYLGAVVGWRGAFYAIVPIAVVAFVWQAIALPRLPAPGSALRVGGVFAPLRRRPIVIGLLACAAFFMGQFTLFSYVRPFLETVTGADAPTVSLVLLVVGIGGLVGSAIVGRFVERDLYLTVTVIPAAMAVIAGLLLAGGGWLWATIILFAIWGLLSTAAPVGWWSWVARVMPNEAEAGGGLMVATVQLSIAAGSAIGGLLFDGIGHGGAYGMSALLLAAGAILAFRAGRMSGRAG
ncbi:MFS transporter [Microbacterium sp. CBS5P-1]|nr:MFS transporter [Microbacterium excoecariae]